MQSRRTVRDAEEAKQDELGSVQVARTLQKHILTGKWRPGSKLPSEQELCKQFKASRTVIRESIQHLRGSGMVNTVNGSGSYVAEGRVTRVREALATYSKLTSDAQATRELLQLRTALEGEAASHLAGRPDRDATPLVRRLDQMRRATTLKRFATLDIEFHMDLLEASGNRLLAELGQALRDRYVALAIEAYRADGEAREQTLRERTLREHQAIVDAIIAGDPEAARDAMHSHVRDSRMRWEEAHQRAESMANEE